MGYNGDLDDIEYTSPGWSPSIEEHLWISGGDYRQPMLIFSSGYQLGEAASFGTMRLERLRERDGNVSKLRYSRTYA